jgi:signal transduction histidine kinase
MAPTPRTTVTPSSTDSFLDDYQVVRLGVSLVGLVILLGFGPSSGWSVVAPYVLALGLMAGHAGWCRLRHVRSPKTMLVLDTNMWGWIMVMAGVPVLSVAILAFLFVLVVLFSERQWRLGLLAVSAGWFAASALTSELAPLDTSHVLGVLLMTGGLAAMISRVRSWLDRLDAGRSQMLGTVSHELRNNLTGMIGLTQLVGTLPDMTFDEAKELVALAYQQAVDASEIVEDLLTVTRLERSALAVTIEPTDVNHEVATTVRRFAGEGTGLGVETRTDLPPADADALRVRQILRNLVSNAVRYGGPSIRITTRVTSGRIEVVVADDGHGVPPDDEKTIFLAYRRSTTSEHAASVGLGLWVSRHLAEAMGGSLEYRRVDGWTEFVLGLQARSEADPVVPLVQSSTA